MKIYELEKAPGVENKAVLEYLKSKGANVKGPTSNIPASMLEDVKKKFGKKEPRTGGMGVVAVPDWAIRKSGEPKEAEKNTSVREKAVDNQEKNASETAEAPKKKKNIIGVYNPQNSSSQKIKAQAQPKPEAKQPERIKPRILPSQLRPARDRKPDDYVEPTPVAEEPKAVPVPEIKAEPAPAPAPAAEPAVAAEIKAAEPKAEETKAEPVSKPVPAEAEKQPEKDQPKADETAEKPVKSDNITSKPAHEKTSDSKTSKESEAIKSLRAKIVKGTVNPDDLLGPSGRPQKKQSGSRDNNKDNRDSRDNRRGQGQSPQGRQSQDNRQNNNNNNQNRRNQDNRSSRDSGSAAPAAMPETSSKGKGKGGKPAKGKFEKNKGDKFDRLENEKAAQRTAKAETAAEPEEEIKVITLPETISIKDFAAKLKMQPAALIKKLFLQGKIVTLNDILDFETAESIALDMDIISEHEVVIDYIEELLKEEEDPEDTLVKRPPVVCIMGHVDHGKTSLLDAIRKTNVTANEAGGITQHIGAYTVNINGESITFLDTPGHEAFTSMRLRGAQATDVAILVVAADDGVMPQTIEAINHARAANIHIIVAVNKIDKPGANIDKVKQELAEQGLVPGDWGGDTIFVPVSAKTGEGIEELLEMVILDTEILELRANPNRKARGVVIEARLDKGRGSVATLLVQKGTLRIGDFVAMGEANGKIRVMTNDKGQRIKEATPSTPVEITGLNGVPDAGEVFVAFATDKEAKNFSQVYVEENKKKLLAGARKKMNLDDVFDQMKAGELKELDLIIKADVQGSVEALKDSLEKLSNDEIIVRCIHSGAGNVSESDVVLASASNAIIIAFNVDATPDARSTIEREKVDMRKYSVIYNAIDDVELAMKGMLEPIYEEHVIGHVEIRQTFKASGIGLIAGSYVTDGIVKRNSSVRLSRDGEQLFEGPIDSLKRFSDDVKEVKSGFECGIVLKGFQDIKEGDIMEVYEMVEVARA